MASAISLSSFTSLSFRSYRSSSSMPSTSSFLVRPQRFKPSPLRLSAMNPKPNGDIETTFFDNVDPSEGITFDPPQPPDGYVPPPAFDELPPETEEEITAAYEEIYGPAYSGESVLGSDIYVMDAKLKKASSLLGRRKREKVTDGFEERVVQVRRVTKVVKGGKKMSFRAIVVVGNKEGQVGVGVGKAKEVVDAIAKSSTNARRNIVTVPMTKYSTFPHRTHPKDITNVAFHRSYPLFASCSEDCTAYVFHGMVYSDLNQNPLIVPLEILRGHACSKYGGVLDCKFHPRQPWLFTAGADSVIKLYCH